MIIKTTLFFSFLSFLSLFQKNKKKKKKPSLSPPWPSAGSYKKNKKQPIITIFLHILFSPSLSLSLSIYSPFKIKTSIGIDKLPSGGGGLINT